EQQDLVQASLTEEADHRTDRAEDRLLDLRRMLWIARVVLEIDLAEVRLEMAVEHQEERLTVSQRHKPLREANRQCPRPAAVELRLTIQSRVVGDLAREHGPRIEPIGPAARDPRHQPASVIRVRGPDPL